ncbi:MAG TPA: YMGG-like glycine zipper-containing protein, partial [Pseudomonadales bacterium]|nr:YMGG-like glycine zipper-containing protein [Pseudomonadales bacterium]
MLRRLIPVLMIVCLVGCETTDPYSGETRRNHTATNAGVGALAGAVLGAAVNHNNRGKGAMIGAAVGGMAGGGRTAVGPAGGGAGGMTASAAGAIPGETPAVAAGMSGWMAGMTGM